MPKPEQALAQPSEEFLAGLAVLAETGIDQDSLDRIATIQLNAGGLCVGPLAQFIGIEKHAPIRTGIVETVHKAFREGTDAVIAVETSLSLFIKRDEHGEVERAPVASKKK